MTRDDPADGIADDLADAARYMYGGAFFSDAEPRGNRQREPQALDDQRPAAEEAADRKPAKHALDLADAAAGRMWRIVLDEESTGSGKECGGSDIEDPRGQRP